MELAVIPPLAHLDTASGLKYQLMLPHMFSESQDYKDFYRAMDPGKHHIIFDNGAAEGNRFSLYDLLEMAATVPAVKEIALPDVLGRRDATVALSLHQLYKCYNNYSVPMPFNRCAFGYVAQGVSAEDAMVGVRQVLSDILGRQYIKVIYIPRLLISFQDRTIRLRLAKMVREEFPYVDVHLFGASQQYLGDIPAASALGFVRSVDTSAPFTFAFGGRYVDRSWQTVPVRRAHDYFDLRMTERLRGLAVRNIETMEVWCNEQAPTSRL